MSKVLDKKVLIVTYYWPPSGGSGVQRWLKFVKYLPSFGVEPHIYTPLNPDFNVKDESFLKEIPKEAIVIKQKITEPYGLYRFFVGKKEAKGASFGITNSSNKSKKKDFAMWVRSNFFIPDPRVFWVKPSVKYLKKYIVENNIEKIITTGPPHSMHLIGLRLKKHFGNKIEWTTDFRDPWTKIFYKEELKISERTDKILQKLEKKVITNCDKLITVSNFLKEEFDSLGAKGKSIAIANGYDDVDYKLETKLKENTNTKFTISYIGLLPKSSNPINLWKALAKKVNNDSQFALDLELIFVGNIDPIVSVILEELGLMKYTSFKGIVAHDKAIEYQKEASLLLLLIPNVPNSKGILTGKFFEYMANEKPILAVGPTDGDVAKIIRETNSGDIISFEEEQQLQDIIDKRYKSFKNNEAIVSNKKYQQYSRKELTKILSNYLFD